MNTGKPVLPIALTMGDPAGVGPQITCAAWEALHHDPAATFFVIGPKPLYENKVPVEEISSPKDASSVFARALPLLSIEDFKLAKAGVPDPATAPGIIASIREAVAFAKAGQVSGVVTNPINKALLYGAGFKHPGHTEYIAALCDDADKSFRPVMLLAGGGLKVALATIHMPLIEVAGALSTETLVGLGRIVDHAMRQDFGIVAPRLAFTGLNPHAGESGTIGREEVDTINPAAEQLRTQGIHMSDARPADTVFAETLDGQFDAVIAMTHDQGLIPVKTLDFWGGVNITLGLPIVRTSPDHGTGYDAAAKGHARADSLIAAIRAARQIATNRESFR